MSRAHQRGFHARDDSFGEDEVAVVVEVDVFLLPDLAKDGQSNGLEIVDRDGVRGH